MIGIDKEKLCKLLPVDVLGKVFFDIRMGLFRYGLLLERVLCQRGKAGKKAIEPFEGIKGGVGRVAIAERVLLTFEHGAGLQPIPLQLPIDELGHVMLERHADAGMITALTLALR